MKDWISRVCCLNAHRIWASTPQIADYRGGHGRRGV